MMTEPFRDPDQLAEGGTMGCSWWRGWIAWDPGAQESFEPQGATAFESPTTGGGPTNSPNVRRTKSDLAPLRRGTGSHVELWSDMGCKECRKDRKRARKCWPQQDRMR